MSTRERCITNNISWLSFSVRSLLCFYFRFVALCVCSSRQSPLGFWLPLRIHSDMILCVVQHCIYEQLEIVVEHFSIQVCFMAVFGVAGWQISQQFLLLLYLKTSNWATNAFYFVVPFVWLDRLFVFFFVFVRNRKTFGRMPNCNWNRRHAIIAVNGTMRRPISYRHLWMADSDNGWWQRYVTLVSGARWFENSIRKCMKLSRKTWHGQYCSVSMIVVKHLVLSCSPFFFLCDVMVYARA